MMNIPRRVFLDTSVINLMLDYGEYIYDDLPIPVQTSSRVRDDINAVRDIHITGQRARWQMAVSPITFKEIIQTRDLETQTKLRRWFFDLWNYWQETLSEGNDLPTFVEAERIRVEWLACGQLDQLPDLEDRLLICDAIVYQCDLFCTRDWKTILRYRETLRGLPIRFSSPIEWWSMIKPWAGLWV